MHGQKNIKLDKIYFVTNDTKVLFFSHLLFSNEMLIVSVVVIGLLIRFLLAVPALLPYDQPKIKC